MRPASTPTLALLALLTACKVSGSLSLGDKDGAAAATTAPAEAPAETPTAVPIRIVRSGDRLVYENGDIEFATNSDDLRGRTTETVLDEFAAVLQQYPALRVRIEGHTDSRGSTSANKKLSDLRAAAIVRALVKRGVDEARLSSVGHGEGKPTRPEPVDCRNRSEDTVPVDQLSLCHETWRNNRRAVFVVLEGAETLPAEGSAMSKPATEPVKPPPPVVATKKEKRRPDWALRLFGGYSTIPVDQFHGGHFGVGLHASQRLGARQRGYIGGGPRLHYRGMRYHEVDGTSSVTDAALHQVGPEGNLLVGGGSKKIVGLFSLRVGLGLGALRGITRTASTSTLLAGETALAGWALGGVAVLGKLTPRWSLGGYAEAGVAGTRSLAIIAEIGLNVAWHFGRGRRDGI